MTPFDCPNCKGSGYEPIPDNPEFDIDIECPSCGGSGINPELFVLFVNLLHDHGDTYVGKQTNRWCECPQRDAHEGTASRLVAAVVAYWKEKE